MEGVYEKAVISEDGEKVTVTVHGVKGSGCMQLQEKYEVLGKRGEGQVTSEFYESPVTVQNDTHVQH